MQKILIIILMISFISIPIASAHPFTEETIPSSDASAPVGTTQIIVFFSEPIDADFSEIKVFDTNGNQIDNKDTNYYEDELSLIVTTPPLEDGVYTASVKVLSKVDGHLVPSAFLFGVGDAIIQNTEQPKVETEIVFLPEAVARFPGLVGQTIVLGAVFASLIIWGTQNKQLIKDELDKIENFHHGKFMSITGIGLMLVFISDILMIAVQTIRLETSPIDAIQTYFGTIWLLRMILTVILLGIWFGMDRKKLLSKKNQIPMLLVSLILISTTTMIGHGAASEQASSAIVLDYIHNLVAAIWIGGIFYFVFTLLPTFSQLKETNKEKMSLVSIPRFSIAFIISIGVVIITGPMLLWLLESDTELITQSMFGQLIILKIAIAAIMVGLGGFFQFKVQRNAEKNFSTGKISVHKKLKRSLKLDAALGIALLGIVALLTNGTLPAGEIQKVDAQESIYGFNTIEFTENSKFDINIFPYSSGINRILIKVSDFEGNPLYDSDEIKVKISNPSKNIAPIEIPMETTKKEENKPIEFQGETTFGFSGEWLIEVEAQRTENANESKMLNLLIKPRLGDIQTQIIEYELPEDAKPLFPLYDGKNSMWISDASAPRIWEFSLETQEFTSYSFDGLTSTFLTQDSKGRIWFTDTPRNQIGYIDLETKEIKLKTIPKLDPVISDNTPLFIQADYEDNIWLTVINKDKIIKYLPEQNEFEEFTLERETLPFALTLDKDGNVWYTGTGSGKIGFIDTRENKLTQISTDIVLQGPEALLFDNDGNLWIAEHTGMAITKYNPILETFERISVPNKDSLPFGMTFDKYDNVWFAQHTIDNLGIYDPDNNNLKEIPIPSEQSFVQFMASDGDNNVWFVEQQTNKIGTVKLTEIPVSITQIQSNSYKIKYTEFVSPLIALGIIATSLFYVKSIQDKRRLNSLINS